MKKKWVEIRKDGYSVEVTGIRRFNIGSNKEYLHIKYVGEKTLSSIKMDDAKQAKEVYKKIQEALSEVTK
jgi:hypothetical protein